MRSDPTLFTVAIGTRDLGVLRTLASIVFGWGVTPLLQSSYSSQTPTPSTSRAAHPDAINLLKSLLLRLSTLLWSSTTQSGTSASTRLFPSHVTKILITAHVSDILRVGISIGWVSQPDEEARQIVSRLLKMLVRLPLFNSPEPRLNSFRLPASQAIVSLGTVGQPIRAEAGATPIQVPAYVQKAASVLLSQQVLRPDGLSGLCAAVFGEGDEGVLPQCSLGFDLVLTFEQLLHWSS